MQHATADLRRFLVEAFSDGDLTAFCFDYFRDVYDDFASGMTKGQKIQLLIERCDRREALSSLQAALQAERPAQYEKRFGPSGPAVAAPAVAAPAVAPAEMAPAGRDPRQVFISHARQDAAFAHRLAADLGSAGWRVWITPDSIPPGEKWVEAIGRGLDGSGVFVVVLTPAAVGSPWVRKETNGVIDLEVRGKVRLIPLEVEACTAPTLWNDYQRISFRDRYEDGLQKLLGRLGGAAPAPIAFDWVTVPAGEFLIGSDRKKDKLAYDDETPQHTLHLPEFRIARVPVTVAQFASFVEATGHRTTGEAQGTVWIWTGSKWDDVKDADWAHPRGPESDVRSKQDHPVTCVSWHDVLAFCRWAGVRLPTEAEWEKAASWETGSGGAGERGKKRVYPWGDQPPTDKLCNFNVNVGDTTPVGSYPDGASPYGVLDMAGNVWEWTSSLYKPYKYDARDGREDAEASGSRTLRGGSFGDGDRSVRCAFRIGNGPDYRYGSIGFRVVSPGF